MGRKYYSKRVGSRAGVRHDLDTLRELIRIAYVRLEEEGYFQEAFGYECIDAGRVSGRLGNNVAQEVYRLTGNPLEWTPYNGFFHPEVIHVEEDLFDIIEFLFDHVSAPDMESGWHHQYGDCGWHFKEFNRSDGQSIFLAEVNPILEEYSVGYRLSELGEVEELGDVGLEPLLDAAVPEHAPVDVATRVREAVALFRRYRSTGDDRRHAVRELADVLEYLRPEVKNILQRPDEQDLFHIANRFDIRHSNKQQKTDYDKPIWHRWMFYYYLATIHACLRLIERDSHRDAG